MCCVSVQGGLISVFQLLKQFFCSHVIMSTCSNSIVDHASEDEGILCYQNDREAKRLEGLLEMRGGTDQWQEHDVVKLRAQKMALFEYWVVQYFLYACCSIFALFYFIYVKQCNQWTRFNIPYAQPIFGAGHKLFLRPFDNNISQVFHKLCREHSDKDVLGFFMFFTPFILIRNEEIVHHILVKGFPSIYLSGYKTSFRDTLMENVIFFTNDKAEWLKQRTTIAARLTTTRIESEFEKLQASVKRLIRTADEHVLSDRPVHAQTFFKDFVSDFTVDYFLGIELESFPERRKLMDLLETVFKPSTLNMIRFFIFMIEPKFQYFKKLRLIEAEDREFLAKLVRTSIEARIKSKKCEDDLFNTLISVYEKSKNMTRDELGEELKNNPNLFSEEDILQLTGLTVISLFGSNETTSKTAGFALHMLSLHPEYQEKIKREVDDTLAKHQAQEITYQVLKDLTFTEQFILEVLRHYPLVPLMRRCAEDYQIPNTNYTLKKGDRIAFSPYSVHMNPEIFSDPERFYPERFDPKDKNDRSRDAFYAFGAGPRKCPGFRMGIIVSTACIASIAQNYKVFPVSHKQQVLMPDFDPVGFVPSFREPALFRLKKRID